MKMLSASQRPSLANAGSEFLEQTSRAHWRLLSVLRSGMSEVGTKRTWSVWLTMSALEGKAELEQRIPK